MIPKTILSEIFQQVQDSIEIVGIREDQAGKVPSYPYFTYKQLINTPEGTYQNIVNYASGSVPTNNVKTTYQKSFSVVSISIYDKTITDVLHEKLSEVVQWFQDYDNVKSMQASGVTPRNRNLQIQDRGFFNDNFYVGRLGFDITFDYNAMMEKEIEAIQSIEIQSNVENELSNLEFNGD